TCGAQVLGYILQFDAKTKGIEQIAIVAVKDVFVLKCVPPLMIYDDRNKNYDLCASFRMTAFIGLIFDASPILGDVHCKRYVILANGDKVETVAVEDVPSKMTVTDAKTILAQIQGIKKLKQRRIRGMCK
ncbi:hypothetical protein B0H11DRAFT_1756200, partial [Mycena galericulata]